MTFDDADAPVVPLELLDLESALKELAVLDPRQARVVELRFFAGLDVEETAEVMGVSARTVKREWQTARAWLQHRLRRERRAAVTPERWRQVKDVLASALERDPDERDRFVAEACGDDAELRGAGGVADPGRRP